MAADPVFIDTNILVYSTRPSALHHAAARAALIGLEEAGAALWISPKVIREYLAVVTRPQATAPALPIATAIADARRFQSIFEIAHPGPGNLDRLLDLLAGGRSAGRQIHDANIVATMLEYGIRRLLTFNSADFRGFSALIEFVPLP